MIRNPQQIMLMRLGAASLVLANFGGDSESDSSTQTSSNTSNTTNYNDKRAVGSDEAIALTGDRNTIDRSTSTSFFDNSNRSTTSLTSFLDQSNRSTNFADSSNRSTTFTDNSDRSTTTNITTTDYGSVGASLGLASTMSKQAFDVATVGIKGAVDTLQLQTKTGADSVLAAFDLAKSSAANSMQNSAQVLGFATSALQKTEDAFAQAKDSGQAKMVMYALAAVAVIGVAFAMKR